MNTTRRLAIRMAAVLITGSPLIAAEQAVVPPVEHGDVLMRSLGVWPKDGNDSRDTLATAKAFKVNRILWIYENTPEFNARVRAAGIGLGTTMSPNGRETWLGIRSKDEIQALVDRFTIRTLDGKQALPEHMQKMGSSAWIDHFQADQTDPEWIRFYADYVAKLYDTGIDTIHRDDAEVCTWALRSGGSFTDSVVAYFQRYLQANFTAAQLATLGVKDAATFDVRKHFRSLGAPADTTLWAWRGSPLMPVFIQAMKQADRDFFLSVRAKVEKRTGRRIPWSHNYSGPKSPAEDAFDFRIGEFQSHHNQPQTLLVFMEQALQAGRPQALISVVDGKWKEHPEQLVIETRKHIATAYATGMIPLVPWCMYMHQAPRYYGSIEDFGDLYHFVSEHRDLFDRHELASVSGVDTSARLYSWQPNKELVFAGGDADSRVWLSRPNLFGFARKKSGTAGAVIHLIDWNASPKPFDITFAPVALVGTRTANLTFLRPGAPSIHIAGYRGETIQLPATTPWGIVKVEPVDSSPATPAAPRILTPLRSVVPAKSAVAFAPPTQGSTIRARFVPHGASDEVEFRDVSDAAIHLDGNGTLEAFSVDARSGARSGSIRVPFSTYQDLTVKDDAWKDGLTAVDLSDRFTATKGTMKVNGSFLAPAMKLMGETVKRGVSTKGNTTLSCALDPSWRIFTVRVGLDDAEDRRPCARFQVLFDNQLATETPIVNPTKLQLADEERRVFTLSVRIPDGAKSLQLRSVDGGFFPDQNNILWAEPTAHAAKPTKQTPNIIFILADDLGWGDLRCYGNPHLDTPVLDALAKEGVRLTAHYSPSPLCSPARAGYLTGRFNHRTGAVDVPSNRGLDRIDLSEKTFGDYFRHAGYATALIGKWHNGLYCRDYLPHRRGFDLFFGFPNGGQDYWKWNLLRNDEAVPHDGRYLTDALNDEAIAFIQQNRDKPFAIFLAHHAPHGPLQAPVALVRKYRERLGKEASEAVAVTYAMIEAMDTGLARVFQKLQDEGVWKNTMIVFTSDNGPWLAKDPDLGSQKRFNGVFTGQKQDVLEGGIRVPGIVAWPGHIPANQVIDTPVHGCDWLPTLFAVTGQKGPEGAKPFDGLDIMSLLLGKPAPALAQRMLPFQRNRYAPVQHCNAAIREGRWKLYWPGDSDSLKKDSARDNPSYLRGVVMPHWQMPLDRHLDPPTTASQPLPRLYDLDADPAEKQDLAATHPEIVQSLARRHDAWFAEIIPQWRQSRARILEHDRVYWKGRATPDPVALFKDFWQWKSAPKGTDPKTADPLKLFRGFWCNKDTEQ